MSDPHLRVSACTEPDMAVRRSIPRLVIAGTWSGVGKTTVAVGLMAALKRRGLAVQPFKVGPDYIDPGYHQAATGVPSRNLDGWMVPEGALLELFDRATRGADVAVIEGVMGVFDGLRGLGEEGSTAQMAKLLGAPVVLVLSVSHMARSAAALALGFTRFDPAMRVGGLLLNNAGSETHYRMAREAIEAAGAGRVLGHLRADPTLKLPERHLGLVPAVERPLPEGFLDRLVGQIEANVDVDGLLAIARHVEPIQMRSQDEEEEGFGDTPNPARRCALDPPRDEDEGHTPNPARERQAPWAPTLFPSQPVGEGARIAVARDEAFSFYYQDNLDLLEAHGATLLPFSPLRDRAIPEGAEALYLGGGFPEVFAPQLAENRSMLESVRRAIEEGMPVHAECGGLMFLSQGIEDAGGTCHAMVGAVPGRCSMRERRLHLGYVEVRSRKDTPLGPAGTCARGHEFHWSVWDGPAPAESAYLVGNQGDRPEGYARGNLLASFVHLHFGANPALAPTFVAAAAAFREKRARRVPG